MRRGKCIHFNGTQNRACDAGVVYAEAFGTSPGSACRAPCIQEYKSSDVVDGKRVEVWKPWERRGQEVMPCAKFQLPTPEEIAEGDAEFARHMDRMRLVMTAVKPWRTWSRKNRVAKQEVVECPACKGRLHLSQSAYNGHVWGNCETEGCVSWME